MLITRPALISTALIKPVVPNLETVAWFRGSVNEPRPCCEIASGFKKVCSPKTNGLHIHLINKIYNCGPLIY